MTARKSDSGKWECSFRYQDWEGRSRIKHARGFESKEHAEKYEADFKRMASIKAGMPFEMFCERYLEEVRPRIRPSTFDTKERMVRLKIVPLFKGMALCEITPLDVLHAQDELLAMKKGTGEPLSPVYLRRINEQIQLRRQELRTPLKSLQVTQAGGLHQEHRDANMGQRRTQPLP